MEPTEYVVVHSHSTGSSWDGTRRHNWRAMKWNGHGCPQRTYPTLEEASATADEMTEQNTEP